MNRLHRIKQLAGLLGARMRNLARGLPPRRELPAWNSLHAQSNLPYLAWEKAELETFDLNLYQTLNTDYLRGQIVFEYGALLNHVRDWRGRTVLDIGSGRSSLPRWLAAQGAQVTAFEYPTQAAPAGGIVSTGQPLGPTRRAGACGGLRQHARPLVPGWFV